MMAAKSPDSAASLQHNMIGVTSTLYIGACMRKALSFRVNEIKTGQAATTVDMQSTKGMHRCRIGN